MSLFKTVSSRLSCLQPFRRLKYIEKGVGAVTTAAKSDLLKKKTCHFANLTHF